MIRYSLMTSLKQPSSCAIDTVHQHTIWCRSWSSHNRSIPHSLCLQVVRWRGSTCVYTFITCTQHMLPITMILSAYLVERELNLYTQLIFRRIWLYLVLGQFSHLTRWDTRWEYVNTRYSVKFQERLGELLGENRRTLSTQSLNDWLGENTRWDLLRTQYSVRSAKRTRWVVLSSPSHCVRGFYYRH